jgi:putative heme-binding domain-containing protein
VARLAIDPIADLLPPGDRGEVFPLTPPPLVFNNESLNHFNALAGLSIYRGNALGEAYRGNALVGESLRNLVHRRVLVPDGPTFQAVRPESGKEFLASEDPWFHPVGFATGPDGALYIADFYRRFVEHPAWVARDTRNRVRWAEGSEHGRIWRVQRRGDARRKTANPFSKSLTIPALVAALDTDNGWRRDTAHRLLVERHEAGSVAVLEAMTPRLRLPEARVAALGAWSALSGSNPRWLLTQLNDPDAHVRAQAARVASAQLSLVSAEDQFREPWRSLVQGLFSRGRQGELDPAVLLQIALGVGFLDDVEGREETLRRIAERSTNRWVRLAAASGSQRPEALAWVPPAPGRLVRLPPPVAIDAASRAAVVEAYRSALSMAGDPRRGAVHVAARCLGCHYLQGRGQRVGPDLAGAASRSSETLLTDILEPSRQVAPDYSTYEVTPTNGEPVIALISGESATRITLRAAGAQDTSFARSEIREIRATGRSLMPDGLEQGLTPQDLADVMAFLHAPDGELLPR